MFSCLTLDCMKEFLILEMIILWSVRYFYICCSIVMVYVRSLSDWWYAKEANRYYSNLTATHAVFLLATTCWLLLIGALPH